MKKAPHTHRGFAVLEHRKKAMHLDTSKEIHKMSESALPWYRKFGGDLEQIRFVFNTCNTCMANWSTNGKAHTVGFHMDDPMRSHMDKKSTTNFQSG